MVIKRVDGYALSRRAIRLLQRDHFLRIFLPDEHKGHPASIRMQKVDLVSRQMGSVEPGTFRHPPLFPCLQIETMQIALIDIVIECINMISRIEDRSEERRVGKECRSQGGRSEQDI